MFSPWLQSRRSRDRPWHSSLQSSTLHLSKPIAPQHQPTMGWLWGKSAPPGSPDSDPLRDLDPSLQEFLSKESPVKYTPAAPRPAPPPEPTASPEPSTTTSDTINDPTAPVVPSESLYPDGRYAHLWATYRPLSVIENEVKSEQEKLADILEGYKERKAQIGRAAVENCVEEQMAVNECYEVGRWKDKLTMCRKENRAFERCYTMQSVCSTSPSGTSFPSKKVSRIADICAIGCAEIPQSPRLPLHLLAPRIRRRSHTNARRHTLPPHAGARSRRRRSESGGAA